MIKRLSNNLFMVKNYSNCYVIQFEDHSVIIDAGMDRKAKGLLELIQLIKKPKAILITHPHLDHINGLAKLKEEIPELKILCSEDAEKFIEGKEVLFPKGPKKLIFKVLTFILKYKPVEAEVLEREYERIKVVETPGHTKGCVSFFTEIDGKKVLFCGDLLINQKNLSLPPSEFNFDEKLQIKSIKKIIDIDWNLLLPGHGEPIEDKERVIEFLEISKNI